MNSFSLKRVWAILMKEFMQMKRDRSAFVIIIGIPLILITLFGLSVNPVVNPLSTALVSADESPFTRTLVRSLENTGFFDFTYYAGNHIEAEKLLAANKVQLVVNIPPNFTADLLRGNRPTILIETDGTDNIPDTNKAVNAATNTLYTAFNYDFKGVFHYLVTNNSDTAAPVNLRVHTKFNPINIPKYQMLPDALAMILTLTMTMITAISLTREREHNTLESLLSTPATPLEIILGKVLPYIMVGYIQGALMFTLIITVFQVPMLGSMGLLLLVATPFIMANLMVGLVLSVFAKNQLQAVQLSVFFFLPSLLLSSFVIPTTSMPIGIQYISNCLPLTHFMNITRDIMLKGNSLAEVWPDLGPILVFLLVVLLIGLRRFKLTLD